MSTRHKIQDATGVFLEDPVIGILYIRARTTPTNAQAGYAAGCIWVNTAGSASSIFYVNTGTNASSTWTNLA